MVEFAKFKYQISPHGVPMPFVPVQIVANGKAVVTRALLDTGAAANVMSYRVGLELGLQWNTESARVWLSGGLRGALSIEVEGSLKNGDFDEKPMVFCWTQEEAYPMILGQVDFFSFFDVSFSQNANVVVVSEVAVKR